MNCRTFSQNLRSRGSHHHLSGCTVNGSLGICWRDVATHCTFLTDATNWPAYEGCSFSCVRRSIKQEETPRTFTFLQSTLLHFAHSSSRLRQDSKQRHFDSRVEIMQGALNLLPFRGPEVNAGKRPPSQSFFFFFWWGGTTKSDMEPSRDGRDKWAITRIFFCWCSFEKDHNDLGFVSFFHLLDTLFFRHSWWRYTLNHVKQPHCWWGQYNFVYDNRVRFN